MEVREIEKVTDLPGILHTQPHILLDSGGRRILHHNKACIGDGGDPDGTISFPVESLIGIEYNSMGTLIRSAFPVLS